MRSANLRRWINRKDCPELLRQFHRLYSMFVANRQASRKDPESKTSERGERAHYDYEGLHFSRASTHQGNSQVSFLNDNLETVFGSIEKIEATEGDKVHFVIRPQLPLSPTVADHFEPFPHVHGRTYSSKMSDTTVIVDPSRVVGHYANFIHGDVAAIVDLSRVFYFTSSLYVILIIS
jgi:hypothetical protein